MTLKAKTMRQIETGIVGDERDFDALVAHLNGLPEDFDHGAFVRMAERWASFYPDYQRPDWMTDEEFARSLAM